MQGSRSRVFALLLVVPALVAVAALALAPTAPAQAQGGDRGGGAETTEPPPDPEPEPDAPAKASLKLDLRGVKGGAVQVNKRVVGIATVRPFVAGQRMRIGIYRRGKAVKRGRKTIVRKEGADAGVVKLRSKRFVEPGKYAVRAAHDATPEQRAVSRSSRRFSVRYPNLGGRDNGEVVQLFHDLLARRGYGNAPSGKDFNDATGRAVHAFRKVNGMARNEDATPGIFKKLAAGKGAFKLRYPRAGHHVEVDLSRQVMVLADKGRPRFTYHISSGAPSTPSDRGHFRFYRRQPGFNSLGMYYSVYYNRGEATHGYHSVPDYPASHGCLRNPIPDAVLIYNWIRLGDSIWVY